MNRIIVEMGWRHSALNLKMLVSLVVYINVG